MVQKILISGLISSFLIAGNFIGIGGKHVHELVHFLLSKYVKRLKQQAEYFLPLVQTYSAVKILIVHRIVFSTMKFQKPKSINRELNY